MCACVLKRVRVCMHIWAFGLRVGASPSCSIRKMAAAMRTMSAQAKVSDWPGTSSQSAASAQRGPSQ